MGCWIGPILLIYRILPSVLFFHLVSSISLIWSLPPSILPSFTPSFRTYHNSYHGFNGRGPRPPPQHQTKSDSRALIRCLPSKWFMRPVLGFSSRDDGEPLGPSQRTPSTLVPQNKKGQLKLFSDHINESVNPHNCHSLYRYLPRRLI